MTNGRITGIRAAISREHGRGKVRTSECFSSETVPQSKCAKRLVRMGMSPEALGIEETGHHLQQIENKDEGGANRAQRHGQNNYNNTEAKTLSGGTKVD